MGVGRGKHSSGPLTLRCSKCKVLEDWRKRRRPSSEGLVRTGREKVVKKYHQRHNVLLVEVRHMLCGRIFWTNHSDAKRKESILTA